MIAEHRVRADGMPLCFTVRWTHEQYYLQGTPSIELAAVCLTEGEQLRCAITDAPEALLRLLGGPSAGAEAHRAYENVVDRLGLDDLDLNAPLPLDTVVVPKPWGREIWYTGIEARGVCRAGGTPLPWIISMATQTVTGDSRYRDPILLKILDPLPDEVYGDLYFELHEEKTEVYVVTHIDQTAWPDGVGRIRYGFDPAVIARYDSEQQFRQAYVAAVKAYEDARAAADNAMDRFRAEEGLSPGQVVPPQRIEKWKKRLDPEVNRREEEHRRRMDSFTALHPLKVGDVVEVKPFTPHALQHGVRVVEFQTPHYERYILSFAQKVLTQAGWDTETAMAKARLTATPHPSLDPVAEEAGKHRVDVIADFEQFQVQRINLAPGSRWHLPPTGSYRIVAGVAARQRLGEAALPPEQAFYIPATAGTVELVNESDVDGIALVALPRSLATLQ